MSQGKKLIFMCTILTSSFSFGAHVGSGDSKGHAAINRQIHREIRDCTSQIYDDIKSPIAQYCVNNPKDCHELTMRACSGNNTSHDPRLLKALNGSSFSNFSFQEKTDFIDQLKRKQSK